VSSTCAVCGSTSAVDGSMCPRSVACPRCGAIPHAWCKRPSGHDAAQLHSERWGVAEAIDREKSIVYPDGPDPRLQTGKLFE
jgi:hypothetical protein